jgi:hypothetical protein
MPGSMTADAASDRWTQLQAEAAAIVAAGAAQGVTLRVVGSAGIRLHCAAPGPLMDSLGRAAKDIDFIVPQRHRKAMRKLLESRGYEVDRDLLVAMEGARYSFARPQDGTEIDVFVERLNFCHPIELGERLTRHPVTIPIEERLLQKVQIITMTTTDLLDAGVLLATHEVAAAAGPAASGPAVQGTGSEQVDSGHIARLLARDWGFHHTATANLNRVAVAAAAGDFGAQDAATIGTAVARLQAAIEAEPKSMGWRMRAKVGERKQWWQDVDEREATY